MFTLRIEHAIGDFDTWTAAFERDPVGRRDGGVRRHRICRPTDDPKYVLIDLDFDSSAAAQAFLEKLRSVWARADLSPALSRGAAATPPRVRVVEVMSEEVYAPR